MARTPNLPLAMLLGALAATTLAFAALHWNASHGLSLPLTGLSLLLLLLLVTLPWLAVPPAPTPAVATCHKCGAVSSPIHSSFCLMCGAFPRGTPRTY